MMLHIIVYQFKCRSYVCLSVVILVSMLRDRRNEDKLVCMYIYCMFSTLIKCELILLFSYILFSLQKEKLTKLHKAVPGLCPMIVSRAQK